MKTNPFEFAEGRPPPQPVNLPKPLIFGTIGGATLLIMTAQNVVVALFTGGAGGASPLELAGLLVDACAMGIACGLIAWAGQALARRVGWIGDAIVGVVVMVAFFAMCMWLFDREMLTTKFYDGGLPMFVFAAVLGAVAGPITARDLRREARDKP